LHWDCGYNSENQSNIFIALTRFIDPVAREKQESLKKKYMDLTSPFFGPGIILESGIVDDVLTGGMKADKIY